MLAYFFRHALSCRQLATAAASFCAGFWMCWWFFQINKNNLVLPIYIFNFFNFSLIFRAFSTMLSLPLSGNLDSRVAVKSENVAQRETPSPPPPPPLPLLRRRRRPRPRENRPLFEVEEELNSLDQVGIWDKNKNATATTVRVSTRRGTGNIESATTAIKSSNCCLFCSSFLFTLPKTVAKRPPPFKYHS